MDWLGFEVSHYTDFDFLIHLEYDNLKLLEVGEVISNVFTYKDG